MRWSWGSFATGVLGGGLLAALLWIVVDEPQRSTPESSESASPRDLGAERPSGSAEPGDADEASATDGWT